MHVGEQAPAGRLFFFVAHTYNACMRIFIAHAGSYDFEKELYEPLKNSSLARNHELFLPHDGGRNINTKPNVDASDLLIADTTFPSTGMGIEIGWAIAAGIPVWCVHKDDAKASSWLRFVAQKIFSYRTKEELVSLLEREIESKTS